MTKQTSPQKSPVPVEPVKSQTSSNRTNEGVAKPGDKPSTLDRETRTEAKETVKNGVQEPNDFDNGVVDGVVQNELNQDLFTDVENKEVKNATNTKIRKRLDELEANGKSVVYPSDESQWDDKLLDRLNKA